MNPFAVREIYDDVHLFSSGKFKLDPDSDTVNLTDGAPGPEHLIKCCDLFEVATKHRMVSLCFNIV